MYFKHLPAGLFLILSAAGLQAQPAIDSLAEQLAESQAARLSESEAGEYDLSEITDRLAWHLRHPLDLNNASAEELDALFILNDLQISSLLDHIRIAGPLADILELQSVKNFDLPLVRQLLPFVTVKAEGPVTSFSPRDIFRHPQQEILAYYSRVLARQKGYAGQDGSRLPGGPERLNFRYRFRQGKHFRLHLLAEKDPGEALTGKNGVKGFDFYSGNVSVQPARGSLKNLLIGDYLLQFGQGLALWNGFSLGKGPAALNIARQSQGIKPHNSSGEGYFFRGAAGSLAWGKLVFTPFFSSRKLDATLSEFDGASAVSAIRRSGIHRSPGELAARKTLGEKLLGLNMEYQVSRQFSIGFTGHRLSFDKPLLPGDDLYERYEFSGESLNVVSLDYTFGRANYFLFGEIAHSRFANWKGAPGGEGWAFINGILFSPAAGLVLAAAWRNYGKDYQALYAAPFGESSNAWGERGIYLGLESRFSPAWTLTAYADAFSWSWLRYRVDAPSSGYELLAQLSFRPDKKFLLYGRYRKTSKPRNREIDGNHLWEATETRQEAARIHAEYHISRRLRLRTRVDYSFFHAGSASRPGWTGTKQSGNDSGPVEHSGVGSENADAGKSGFSIFQDIRWAPGKLSFNARISYFNTDDYDSRIYSYESSLLSGASLAFYYDEGFKTYLGIRWKPWKTLDIRLRGGLLRYFHRQRIGSGPDEIKGKQKPDVRMQIRLSF
ncbi:hypothetical protein EDD80_105135 [Anseongella ginsenosidimutans]|uniref:Helix-hairpin-helix protein n=1 Tax=Anseongella ginsenosidimutans TaxID=496056 RepID=A0A4R3KRG1_9SPHI|nr:hypothetical protein [Anseongella ginsenosidimutans]QEC52928.1 helix-hairpin-helix domain-containing protein [Anseongella ginsenosidimutans]TCS87321.1 hypothetical protein EDD80_105135 [Anseongella ginsenosidimutans]